MKGIIKKDEAQKSRMMQIDNKYKEWQETKTREVVVVPFKGREVQRRWNRIKIMSK